MQIQPPWKPDIQSDTDTKYIPDEFANEPVHLTPPKTGAAAGTGGHQLSSIAETEELPYFESFSYHGSRASLSSYLSNMSTNDVHAGPAAELYG